MYRCVTNQMLINKSTLAHGPFGRAAFFRICIDILGGWIMLAGSSWALLGSVVFGKDWGCSHSDKCDGVIAHHNRGAP